MLGGILRDMGVVLGCWVFVYSLVGGGGSGGVVGGVGVVVGGLGGGREGGGGGWRFWGVMSDCIYLEGVVLGIGVLARGGLG